MGKDLFAGLQFVKMEILDLPQAIEWHLNPVTYEFE